MFRDVITDWLQDLILGEDLYEPTAKLLAQLLEDQPSAEITDICSGAGGPWTQLKGQLEELCGPVELTLTDKFPNRAACERVARTLDDGRTTFRTDSVDATDLPSDASGVVTTFSAFHHLPPSVARQVLAGAWERRQPIGVFDIVDRASVRSTIRYFPARSFRYMHRLRPRRWYHVVFTYVLPVLPFAITWDATVSNIRAYGEEDLAAMTADLGGDDWIWDIGTATTLTDGQVTYLLGRPIG